MTEETLAEKLTEIKERLKMVERRLYDVETMLAGVRNDIDWLKRLYKSLDYRVWFIVAGVIVTIIVSLLR